MIKRIVSGFLMTALAAGCAVGASAAPSFAAGSEEPVMHADFDVSQVSLQDGQQTPDEERGRLTINKKSVGEGTTQDVFTLAGAGYLSDATEYQIVMLGKPTGYWVRAALYTTGSFYRSHCAIYYGAPSDGGSKRSEAPFACETKPTAVTGKRFTFKIGLNRVVEASGTIRPTGDVSLDDGYYNSFGLPFSLYGVPSVPSGGETTFDSVARLHDDPDNKARTEFAYEIKDKGQGTGYWVGGVSHNQWAYFMYSGDASCGIYDQNPLYNGDQLDHHVPLTGAPFTCTATKSFKQGLGHTIANFTVSRR
jgi:hypothetical protein